MTIKLASKIRIDIKNNSYVLKIWHHLKDVKCFYNIVKSS